MKTIFYSIAKTIIVFFVSCYLFLSLTNSFVNAISTPSFPVCSNPQGQLLVSYDSGIHGIPGSTNIYRGSDAVYKLTDTSLIQCFCDESGEGIQSNWWKTSSLTQEERNILLQQGWIYIPDGAAWGLSSGSYFVQNTTYLCYGGTGGGGQVASTLSSDQVLGLVSTGNIMSILKLLAFAIIALTIGMYLKLRSNKKLFDKYDKTAS